MENHGENLRGEVREIMSQAFGLPVTDLPSQPTPDNTRGWDSLTHLDLIETLELRYSISISHAEAVSLLDEDVLVSFLTMKKG